MNKLHAFLAIFLLSALCGCRSKKEEETEIENRYIQLLHALVTDDTPALRREQHYITDTLPPDTLLRSEEHTSELQSRQYLVCRLLLEKKKQLASASSLRHFLT